MKLRVRARTWALCGAISAAALLAFLQALPDKTPHDLRSFDPDWLDQASDHGFEEAGRWFETASPKEKRELAHRALCRPNLRHHDAFVVLVEVGNEESVPYLLDWLKSQGDIQGDAVGCARAHCIEALEKITGKKLGCDYEDWKDWERNSDR